MTDRHHRNAHAGQLYQLTYGAGTETRQYNSLGQLTHQSVPGSLDMTYNYSATQNNGRIISSADAITGENTSYTYDALNRLTGASNASWGTSYTYDEFGNLTSKAGVGGWPNPAPTMTATYDVHNQPTGVSYDANGNAPIGTFNVENRLTWEWTGGGAASFFEYDMSGKRVMNGSDPDPNNLSTGSNPTVSYNFYGITGQRLATVKCTGYTRNNNCAIVGQNVYFAGKLVVSGGVPVVTDRLGSVRANTQGESFAYYPFGEERTSTVDGREKFGTYFRDGLGLDYADQRYYGSGTGRFLTADPAGLAIATPASPASWNRYAYVASDPVNFADPGGTDLQYIGCGTFDAIAQTVGLGDEIRFNVVVGYCQKYTIPGGEGTGSAGDVLGGSAPPTKNPCNWTSLTPAQQAMLSPDMWNSLSAAAQQQFIDVTTDAAALGMPLNGLTVSTITVAGENGASQTEVNLSGNTEALKRWLDSSNMFTSSQQDPLAGAPHSGYDGNYRQNTLTWSMQVNTRADGVQIDIDPWNPAAGLAGLVGHGLLQFIPNRVTRGDTNPFRTRNALQRRFQMGDPCTGN